MLVTGGNHEIGSSEAWLHYMHRWPTPYREARSTSPLYWSADVGPVHVVALNSYDNFVNGGDRLQRKWLEDDLSKVDRAATPWLVVMMHAPFYNSNSAHALEAELMRLAYEPLLLKYGVDLVLSGHVHAYERSDAGGIYDAAPNPCGPVYLNLGDGGNREGAYVPWLTPQPRPGASVQEFCPRKMTCIFYVSLVFLIFAAANAAATTRLSDGNEQVFRNFTPEK